MRALCHTTLYPPPTALNPPESDADNRIWCLRVGGAARDAKRRRVPPLPFIPFLLPLLASGKHELVLIM